MIENPVRRLRRILRCPRSTLQSRSLAAGLSSLLVMGTLAIMLGLFRAAIVSYLGSSLAWWIVVGVIGGLISLQTILLAKQRGGTQMSLLGSLFGVIGMLGLAVLAAIFFSLAWPGVVIALLAGAWNRMISESEKEEGLKEEQPVVERKPAEPSHTALRHRGA